MHKKNYKIETSTNKSFMAVIIIFILIFFVTAFLSLRLISYRFYQKVKDESISIAKNHANELSHSDIALDTINTLIDDRLELTIMLVAKSNLRSNTNIIKNVAR